MAKTSCNQLLLIDSAMYVYIYLIIKIYSPGGSGWSMHMHVMCGDATRLYALQEYLMMPPSQSTSARWHLSSFTTVPPLMSRAA